MQYNVSPDTIIDGMVKNVTVDGLLDGTYDAVGDHCMAANGQHFRKDIQGFLPSMMQKMYDDRVLYKNKMIEAQKELEKVNAKLKELS
jgi:DNA polymerase elongation subunit (family B)